MVDETDEHDYWKDDQIGDRKELADFLISVLKQKGADGTGQHGGYVLNIDAQWGAGKSYFLEGLKHDLSKDHAVVFVDAWKTDFTEEAMVPFISALKDTCEKAGLSEDLKNALKDGLEKGTKVVGALGKGMGLKFLQKIFGEGVTEAINILDENTLDKNDNTDEIIDGDDSSEIAKAGVSRALTAVEKLGEEQISEHEELLRYVEQFRSSLQETTRAIEKEENLNLPLFVLVDELDRCRPSYAIQMLERVKHFFSVPGFVFVFATDTEQLSHSTQAVYGNNFNSKRYLQRFFDDTFSLPIAGLDAQIRKLSDDGFLSDANFSCQGFKSQLTFIKESFKKFGVGARESQRALGKLKMVRDAIKHKFPLHLPYLLTLIIAEVMSIDELHAALTADDNGNSINEYFGRNPRFNFKGINTHYRKTNGSILNDNTHLSAILFELIKLIHDKNASTEPSEDTCNSVSHFFARSYLYSERLSYAQSRGILGGTTKSRIIDYPRITKTAGHFSNNT